MELFYNDSVFNFLFVYISVLFIFVYILGNIYEELWICSNKQRKKNEMFDLCFTFNRRYSSHRKDRWFIRIKYRWPTCFIFFSKNKMNLIVNMYIAVCQLISRYTVILLSKPTVHTTSFHKNVSKLILYYFERITWSRT